MAELMGHSKVDTTLNVYTQTLTDAHRAALAKVSEELFAHCLHRSAGRLDNVSVARDPFTDDQAATWGS